MTFNLTMAAFMVIARVLNIMIVIFRVFVKIVLVAMLKATRSQSHTAHLQDHLVTDVVTVNQVSSSSIKESWIEKQVENSLFSNDAEKKCGGSVEVVAVVEKTNLETICVELNAASSPVCDTTTLVVRATNVTSAMIRAKDTASVMAEGRDTGTRVVEDSYTVSVMVGSIDTANVAVEARDTDTVVVDARDTDTVVFVASDDASGMGRATDTASSAMVGAIDSMSVVVSSLDTASRSTARYISRDVLKLDTSLVHFFLQESPLAFSSVCTTKKEEGTEQE